MENSTKLLENGLSDIGTEFSTITSRTYKDGVFTTLFGDKAKICELYNALHETDCYKETDIEIHTLQKALYKKFKDDLAFTVKGRFVVLIEHQSTPSQNLPIRIFLYLARVYERLLDVKSMYRDSLVKIPTPELYVLYNGEKEWPEELTLRLSDAFQEERESNFLELETTVININLDKHNHILARSQTLMEYCTFIERIRSHMHSSCSRDKAIELTIKECIEADILRSFLTIHGGEVYNMLFEEYNLETAIEVAKEEGLAQGEERGKVKGALETLLELNLPTSVIREKLYQKYPDERDLVDLLLLHEDPECYDAKE